MLRRAWGVDDSHGFSMQSNMCSTTAHCVCGNRECGYGAQDGWRDSGRCSDMRVEQHRGGRRFQLLDMHLADVADRGERWLPALQCMSLPWPAEERASEG